MVDFNGKCIGKYTIHYMDPMGTKKTPPTRSLDHWHPETIIKSILIFHSQYAPGHRRHRILDPGGIFLPVFFLDRIPTDP